MGCGTWRCCCPPKDKWETRKKDSQGNDLNVEMKEISEDEARRMSVSGKKPDDSIHALVDKIVIEEGDDAGEFVPGPSDDHLEGASQSESKNGDISSNRMSLLARADSSSASAVGKASPKDGSATKAGQAAVAIPV